MDFFFNTYTGKTIYTDKIETISPDSICIEDIAHALSNICRFGGHCNEFYSVAQHSILCSQYASKENKKIALLHDATEAYLNDMISPIKNILPEYKKLERDLWKVIAKKFDLPQVGLPPEVCQIDLRMLATEKRDLLSESNDLWECLVGCPPYEEKIRPLSPEAARKYFYGEWENL